MEIAYMFHGKVLVEKMDVRGGEYRPCCGVTLLA
jgi:hypothetical protein